MLFFYQKKADNLLALSAMRRGLIGYSRPNRLKSVWGVWQKGQ